MIDTSELLAAVARIEDAHKAYRDEPCDATGHVLGLARILLSEHAPTIRALIEENAALRLRDSNYKELVDGIGSQMGIKDSPESFCGDLLDKAIADMKAENATLQADARTLRRLLWCAHNRGGGYGDDGELQLDTIDFKRLPVDVLEQCIVDRGIAHYVAEKNELSALRAKLKAAPHSSNCPATWRRERCDCVDSNGIKWPDCSCSGGWQGLDPGTCDCWKAGL